MSGRWQRRLGGWVLASPPGHTPPAEGDGDESFPTEREQEEQDPTT
jgi:hypothetical protein